MLYLSILKFTIIKTKIYKLFFFKTKPVVNTLILSFFLYKGKICKYIFSSLLSKHNQSIGCNHVFTFACFFVWDKHFHLNHSFEFAASKICKFKVLFRKAQLLAQLLRLFAFCWQQHTTTLQSMEWKHMNHILHSISCIRLISWMTKKVKISERQKDQN